MKLKHQDQTTLALGHGRKRATACGFRNPQGLLSAWKSAQMFGGDEGRVATLPDIISARLGTDCNEQSPAWYHSYTTSSAEYVGMGKSGRRLVIVAHGVGPMSTSDGVFQAYSYESKDRERNRRGGRISRAEFLKLESGFYGSVEIVDLEYLCKRYADPFVQILSTSEAFNEPLVAARLGAQWLEYIERHDYESAAYISRCTRERDKGSLEDTLILAIRDASNCCYNRRYLPKNEAFAHLLRADAVYCLNQADRIGLVGAIGAHEWRMGTRVAGVRGKAAPSKIDQ